MDVTTFTEFISTLGFPIACVVAMFWAQNKEREQHKEESDKWIEALNNNTRVVDKLCSKLDMEDVVDD
jgi:hypothetical protein